MTALAVIGGGGMGSQIAQQAALHGVEVRLQDVSEEQLRKAVASNRGHLARRVEKGSLDADAMAAALARIRTTTSLEEAAAGSDFVIEAVVERLDVKRDVFRRLDVLCPPTVVLASNTSTMPISEIVEGLAHPARCLNMHFFLPVLVMDLVEVVRGPATSDAAVDRALALAAAMGRTAIVVNREIPGFVVNRILHRATQEAYRLLDAGVATHEDIDTAVEKGLNWPLGPFRLGDLTGLDVTLNARRHMYEVTGDERFKPSPALEAKVGAGKLGRKTGEGWYTYTK